MTIRNLQFEDEEFDPNARRFMWFDTDLAEEDPEPLTDEEIARAEILAIEEEEEE